MAISPDADAQPAVNGVAQMDAARLYGLQFAWHNYCWAAAGVLARAVERVLSRVRLRLPVAAAVQALDHGLLRVAHRFLFVLVHREISRPEQAEAGR